MFSVNGKMIIINNSDITGMDLLHDTTIGIPWWILTLSNELRSDVLDISLNWTRLKTDLVSCSFSTKTDTRRRGCADINRLKIENILKGNDITNKILEKKEYYTTILNSKFVISPEGNGIDCHRHYEALLCGSIPIIEEHPAMRIKYANMPVLYTHDYSEITTDYLSIKYDEIQDNLKRGIYNFDKLFLEYYPLEKQKEIKQRCNHWIHKRLGIRNYYI